MRKITICHKEYPFRVNLGTLEELEKKGYTLQQIGSMEGVSATFLIDIIEIVCGIDRKVIEQLPLSALTTLYEDVSEALGESFESGYVDDGGEEPGEV